MPVPKKRLGNSDQWTRRSQWKGKAPDMTLCPVCRAYKLPHKICGNCGTFKGRQILKEPFNWTPETSVSE